MCCLLVSALALALGISIGIFGIALSERTQHENGQQMENVDLVGVGLLSGLLTLRLVFAFLCEANVTTRVNKSHYWQRTSKSNPQPSCPSCHRPSWAQQPSFSWTSWAQQISSLSSAS